MTNPILVTGGTGTLGRTVVPRLLAEGHRVRVLSRNRHPDLDALSSRLEHATGDLRGTEGLDAAVAGVHTVVHLAGAPSGDDLTTARLVKAATAAGVTHLILMSVVGADRVPVRTRTDRALFGYFAAKHRAEQVVASSSLGWSTLRSTQFHESLLRLTRALSRSPVVPVLAGFNFQPIAADEVATRLVQLVESGPSSLAPELAGPETHRMNNLVRTYLELLHHRRLIVEMPLPGPAARAYRAGANLSPDRAVGHQTWKEFLTLGLTGSEVTRDETPRTTTRKRRAARAVASSKTSVRPDGSLEPNSINGEPT
ncbi:MAG: SDR family oxidoreductase [Janthinobacterium lividum]